MCIILGHAKILKKVNNQANLFITGFITNVYGKRGLYMKNLSKSISAVVLCTLLAAMQSVSADPINTGLNNAVIGGTTGGYAGIEKGVNTATLKFNGDTHVNWNTLNVGKNETLNFNAVDGAKNITVLNTVTSGMSEIYGTINANEGIGKLIISNPNGMIYNGASFNTAGDTMLTTQQLNSQFDAGKMTVVGVNTPATQGITITDSNFNIGGEFNIVAPTIEAVKAAVKADKGVRFVTANGRDFLVSAVDKDANHKAVRLETVSIDGNVYVVNGKDIITFVNGGEIKGDLTIESDGNVAVNYVNDNKILHITGDVKADSDGRTSYLRKAKVDGNVDMSNSGGFLEIGDVEVGGNVNLKTTVLTNSDVKHFIHVVGDSDIKGDLNVDSIHNVHIGGYDKALKNFYDGNLKVGGNINALAREGSVTVTIDTEADKVNLESGTLNIMTNGKANIKANAYEFKAKNYIGGVKDKDVLIDAMENYKAFPAVTEKAYVNIEGGNVNKIETADKGYAFIRSKGNMNVNGVDANKVKLSADQADIVIGKNVKADLIEVDGETKNLTVELPSRDYTLKFTDIKDTEVITVDPATTITYEMSDGENGWNKGTQTADNTRLIVPAPIIPDPEPTPPPTPTPTPTPTDDNDNVKVLNNLNPDQVSSAIDANQAYTPIAYAADLDDEIDTGVRKNVDGSVTVVRAFTPSK